MLEKDEANLHMLAFKYKGNETYKDELIYKENTHHIENILTDKNRMYILIKAGANQFNLKCFRINSTNHLEYKGEITDVQASSPSFVGEARKNNKICANILIANDQKFFKIYDDVAGHGKPAL